MQENIIITFDRTVAAADVQGFKDVLADVILEQGSSAQIQVESAPVLAMEGCAVAVRWEGSYRFTTPDESQIFSNTLSCVVRAPELDHELLISTLAHRADLIGKAYRDALRGIRNLALSIKSGAVTPADPVEYIRQTTDAALSVFPNTN